MFQVNQKEQGVCSQLVGLQAPCFIIVNLEISVAEHMLVW